MVPARGVSFSSFILSAHYAGARENENLLVYGPYFHALQHAGFVFNNSLSYLRVVTYRREMCCIVNDVYIIFLF